MNKNCSHFDNCYFCPYPPDSCPINPNPPTPPGDMCEKEYGFFYTDRINIGALYSGIVFTKSPVKTNGILWDDEFITVIKPGIYSISYEVHFPETSIVSAVLYLQANGINYPGATRTVHKNGIGIPYTQSASLLYAVTGPVTFRISSSQILNLTGSNNEVMAAFTIIEL